MCRKIVFNWKDAHKYLLRQIMKIFFLNHNHIYKEPSAQSSLSIFAQKYFRNCKYTYLILQNKYLRIYEDSFGVKILRDTLPILIAKNAIINFVTNYGCMSISIPIYVISLLYFLSYILGFSDFCNHPCANSKWFGTY